MQSLMSKKTLESLCYLANLVPDAYRAKLDIFAKTLVEKHRIWDKPGNNNTQANVSLALFEEQFGDVSIEESALLKVALLANIAKITPDLVQQESYPNSVLSNYPSAFERLVTRLEDATETPIKKNDHLFNRLNFVLATSIPCGAQSLDSRSSVPLKSVILSIPRQKSAKAMINFIRCQGWGPWFRGHTDVDYLTEFNEAGWDRYYLQIAELLITKKEIRGLAGTSWFYDPQLVDISPRLAYLQQRQLERGAFLMRHRSTEADIQFATQASSTRKRLFDEGKYIPVSHSLIWGRNEILNWAKNHGISPR